MRPKVPSQSHRSRYSQTVLRGGKSFGSAFQAPCPKHIEDRVENLADIHRPRTPAAFGRSDQGGNERPFGVSQITRVAQSTPIRSRTMFWLPHVAPRFDSGA